MSLTPHLLRHGVEHALEAGRRDLGEELMTSFARNVALFERFGPRGVSYWLADAARFPREERGALFAEWHEVIQRLGHVLRRGDDAWPAHRILVQLCVEHGTAAPDTKASLLAASALAWLRASRPSWPIARIVGRTVARDRRRILRVSGQSGEDGPLGDVDVRVLSRTRALSWGADGTARVWSLEDGAELACFSHAREELRGALELADGRILTWTAGGGARIWSVESAANSVTLVEGDVVAAFKLGDDRLVVAGRATVTLWDADGRSAAEPVAMEASVEGAAPLDHARFLTWSADGSVRLWSPAPAILVEGGPKISRLSTLRGAAVWGADRGARYLAPNGSITKVLEREHVAWALALGGGNVLCGLGNRVVVFDTAAKAVVATEPGDWGEAELLVPGEVLLINQDDLVGFWRWREGAAQLMAASDRPTHGDANITVGKLILRRGDETIAVIDPKTRKRRCVLEDDSSVLGAAEISDELVLSWAEGGALSLWFVGEAPEADAREDHDWVHGAIVLRDDRVLTWSSGGRAQGPRLWGPTGAHLATLSDCEGRISGAAELADGRIATWRFGGAARVWSSDGASYADVLDGSRLGIDVAMRDPFEDVTLVSEGITVTCRPGGTSLEISTADGERAIWHGEAELCLHALTRAGTAVVSWGPSLAFIDVRLHALCADAV